jgi:hypothetical protein
MLERYGMPEISSNEIVMEKPKFDTLLRTILATPPLLKSEVKVAKPKPKKRKSIS